MNAMNWEMIRQSLGENMVEFLPACKDLLSELRGKDISTDSRTIEKGQWYVSLKGDHFDGDQFVSESVKRGAAGVICHDSSEASALNVPYIVVRSGILALQQLSKSWLQLHDNLKVIGITGSVGKTTARNMISSMLEQTGRGVLVPSGNFNNEIGVPKTLLQISNEHSYVVLEFGARHKGDIQLLTDLCTPDLVLCLNIGTSHVEEFGSLEILRNTKLEIIRTAPSKAISIGFDQDKDLQKEAQHHFGWSPNSTVYIKNFQRLSGGGMRVSLGMKEASLDITLKQSHDAYPINVSAAAAVGVCLDLPAKQIQQGLENFNGTPGRFHIVKTDLVTLVDDSYNASPESLNAGLSSLTASFCHSPKVLILGDMKERGASSSKDHRLAGIWASYVPCVQQIIYIGSMYNDFQSGLNRCQSHHRAKFLFFEKAEEYLASRPSFENCVLFFKASNSTGVHKIYSYFSKGL